MLNKNEYNVMRFEAAQKKAKLNQLKMELEKIMERRLRQNLDGPELSNTTQSALLLLNSKPKIHARDTNASELKRTERLKVQIEMIEKKLDNVVYYQNTLR